MVYRNCLGGLEAKADISVFDSFSGKYYSLHTVIDGYTSKRWSFDTSVEDIVREMEADGFTCTVSRDGFGQPRIACTHTETQAVIDAMKAEQARKFAGATRGYVRYGELPEDGRSRNYRDNVQENGVSCFEAEFAADGSYRLLLNPVLEVSYLTVVTRQAYRLYGEVVGTGADGEPLLKVEKTEKI